MEDPPSAVTQRGKHEVAPAGGAALTTVRQEVHTWAAHSLDFREDDVDVGAADILAIDDLAVFAQFGPVLPIQLLPRRLRVSVDRKLLKRYQELLYVDTLRHDGKISETRTGTC